MAGSLKDAMKRNQQAAEELNAALRACLHHIRDKPEVVAEGRFRVISGGRRAQPMAVRAKLR